jgi:hypothetical protein
MAISVFFSTKYGYYVIFVGFALSFFGGVTIDKISPKKMPIEFLDNFQPPKNGVFFFPPFQILSGL